MYGVVVAHAYAPVYGACEGSPVSGAHDVVYAHVESAPVVRYARPVASVGVAVDEPLRERVVAAEIFDDVMGSDHCPIMLELA